MTRVRAAMIREDDLLRKRWILAFCISVTLLFGSENSNANSLNGSTGLITIPTAEILRDRQFSFGMNWLDRKYVPYAAGINDVLVVHCTFGYLPFLEISQRLTRLAARDLPLSRIGIGDRMISFRLKLLSEGIISPSVALGIQDPIGNSFFNSSYLVASKRFRLSHVTTALHLGYGTSRTEAEGKQFAGLFGGLSLYPGRFSVLILEHDSEKFNCGVRVLLLNHLEILVALLDFDTFSGGISYRFGY